MSDLHSDDTAHSQAITPLVTVETEGVSSLGCSDIPLVGMAFAVFQDTEGNVLRVVADLEWSSGAERTLGAAL